MRRQKIRPKETQNIIFRNNTTEQPEMQLPLEGNLEEEKIVHTSTDKNVLLRTSDVLEKVLDNLVIDEEVYGKLLQLQDLIETKLLTFKHQSGNQFENADDVLSIKNLSASKSLASSMHSLCSLKSMQDLDGDMYKKFLSNVNCPFCSKVEDDKINLIKHLDGNCQPLINNVFEGRNFIPFSAFQILPNNTIKCNICSIPALKNLKCFFKHVHSQLHKTGFAKAKRTKSYTEYLFCSSCKILVPNNYTQINFHITHSIHKSRGANAPNAELGKVDCVYLKSKKFKCFCSPRTAHQTLEDILKHFEKDNHQKLKNRMFPILFCEICMVKVGIFEVMSHFDSHSHIDKEKSLPLQESFELCYYCGSVHSSLKELSVHMKTECLVIKYTREQNLKIKKLPKTGIIKNDSKNEKSKESSMSENDNQTEGELTEGEKPKEDLHVIVKDSTDVLEVYRYFKKFGEITRVQIYQEKNVLLEFRDKSALEDALLLREVIYINGVKVEITTDLEFCKPDSAVKQLEKRINPGEEPLDVSDKSDSSSSGSTDDPGPVVSNNVLEDLFQRVSRHLSNTAKTFGTFPEEEILEDCASVFGPKRKCSIVGFGGSNLGFPVEAIDVYCDMTEECSKTNPVNSADDHDFLPVNLVKRFFRKLCDASEWREVHYCAEGIWPYIKCTHVATQKSCTFNFSPSTKLLTDMLSYCIEEIDGAENVCLIVRFWLTVHNYKRGELDFVIVSLLLFFLMRGYDTGDLLEIFDVPSVTLQFARIVYEKTGYISRSKNKVTGSSNVVEMFREFLKFLSKFNFKKNIILLPVNCPVPKKIIDNLLFHQFFESSFDFSELQDSPLCVIDPLMCVNLAKDVSRNELEFLVEAARNTLKNTG